MNLGTVDHLGSLRAIFISLPGITETASAGAIAFYVNMKLMARLNEDGETLGVYTEDRDTWIKSNPNTYFVTDHYRNYPIMLVRLASAHPEQLKILLLAAWKMRATKSLLKEYEERNNAV